LGIEDREERLAILGRMTSRELLGNFEGQFMRFGSDDPMIAVILWYSLIDPINADYISDSHVQKCFDDYSNRKGNVNANFSPDSLNEQINNNTILTEDEITLMRHVFSNSRPVQDIS